jgi:hypothetical protein
MEALVACRSHLGATGRPLLEECCFAAWEEVAADIDSSSRGTPHCNAGHRRKALARGTSVAVRRLCGGSTRVGAVVPYTRAMHLISIRNSGNASRSICTMVLATSGRPEKTSSFIFTRASKAACISRT